MESGCVSSSNLHTPVLPHILMLADTIIQPFDLALKVASPFGSFFDQKTLSFFG
jgi:hypothetical protein